MLVFETYILVKVLFKQKTKLYSHIQYFCSTTRKRKGKKKRKENFSCLF